MSVLNAIVICLHVILTGVFQEEQGWRGLLPAHSTRADVERLLGPPKKPEAYLALYDLGSEAVFIEYSSGPCRKDREGGLNVPLNTVIRIVVNFEAGSPFSDLRLDKNKYEKTEDGHLPGVTYYYNEEEGVRVTVSENGTVASITYGLLAKDKHLLCPRSKCDKDM